MKNLKVMYSKNTDDWRTPTAIYNYFIKDLNCIDPFPFKSETDNLSKCYLGETERERETYL